MRQNELFLLTGSKILDRYEFYFWGERGCRLLYWNIWSWHLIFDFMQLKRPSTFLIWRSQPTDGILVKLRVKISYLFVPIKQTMSKLKVEKSTISEKWQDIINRNGNIHLWANKSDIVINIALGDCQVIIFVSNSVCSYSSYPCALCKKML